MKKLFVLPFISGMVLASFTVQAQKTRNPKETEQIIILHKQLDGSTKADTISSFSFNGRNVNPDNYFKMYKGFRDAFNMDSLKFSSTPKTFLGVMTKENGQGVEVTDVTKNSPAEKAGIEKGDIITKAGKEEIKSPEDLSQAITRQKSGDKVNIELLRNNKEKNVTATLSERSEDFAIDLYKLNNLKGLNLRDFTYPNSRIVIGRPLNRLSLGLQIQDTEDGNGVKVLSVEKGSAAEKAGVQVGDLITAFNGNKVTDVNSVLMEKGIIKSGEDYTLSIIRNQKPMSITVKMPKILKKGTL